ncbi:MAG: heme lyase CcmF/NrfE family subunit [Actinomycetota bacterium]
MTSNLGNFALLLTLIAAGYAVVVGFVAALRHRELATRSAEGALQGAAVAVTVAGAALLWALFHKDFSIEYVQEYTSKDLSLFYTLGAFWAGQAGSLLLWAWLLGLAGALVVVRNRFRNRELMPWVVPIIGTVLLFFTVLATFYANAFTRMAVVPSDGQGLNPLLQNYGQWVHPIALYAGWVGFTVPFAFALAALITGRLDDTWIRATRKWTLWSWIFLTAGILFGGRWAYVELGWGGYWAWDPVENASLMPWLTATAFLHSAVVQEKRGMMKAWNVALITATFALSIFGTFLTRSGVISSVHAFAQSTMGPLLIGFTLLIVIASTLLTVWRLPELKAQHRYGSVLARESSFLATNLVLVAMTVVVFWGTVFPLVMRVVRTEQVAVGPPFFMRLMAPLAIVLMVIVGMCPLLAWRHADPKHLQRNFKVPVGAGVLAFLAVVLASRGHDVLVAVVLGLGAFVLTTVVEELRRGVHARRTVHGESLGAAIVNLFKLTPRRYAGPIVHAGVIILITGIAVNLAFKQQSEGAMKVGERRQVGAYTIAFDSLTFDQSANRFGLNGTFTVTQPNGDTTQIVASQVNFANQQTVTEVGIHANVGADLYLVMNNADPNNQVATIQFFVEPGMVWIWVGMLIVVLGGILAAIPRRANMQIPEPGEPEPIREDVELVGAGEGRA